MYNVYRSEDFYIIFVFFFPLNLLRLIRRTVYENNDSLVYVELFLKFRHCSMVKLIQPQIAEKREEELASTTSFVNCNLITRNFYKTSLAILTSGYINLHLE